MVSFMRDENNRDKITRYLEKYEYDGLNTYRDWHHAPSILRAIKEGSRRLFSGYYYCPNTNTFTKTYNIKTKDEILESNEYLACLHNHRFFYNKKYGRNDYCTICSSPLFANHDSFDNPHNPNRVKVVKHCNINDKKYIICKACNHVIRTKVFMNRTLLRRKNRSDLKSMFSKNNNNKRYLKTLECTVGFLKEYIEGLFSEGMTWDNYGKGKGNSVWQIDHIKPVSSFDLFDETQVKECFHYNNIQPLWAGDNSKKGSKLNWVKHP